MENSISTFAVSQDTEYKLHYQSYARTKDLAYVDGSSFANTSWNVPIENYSFGSYNVRNWCWSDYRLVDKYTFYRTDGSIMGTEGMSLQLHIKNIMNVAENMNSSSSSAGKCYFDPSRIQTFILRLHDAKGKVHYQELAPTDYILPTSDPQLFDLIIDIDSLPCDPEKVEVEFIYYAAYAFPGVDPNIYSIIYKHSGPGNTSGIGGPETTVDFYCRTDTGGLLGNIIKIVTNIKDGITDLGGKVTSGFGNVVNSITQLPSKIWSFFEDGLKGLFIPTEEQLTDVKTDWDNLLSDRFGGLYQSVQLIDDYAKTFTNTDSKNTIKLPELSVDLADSTFTFGGQDVQIIPDKFSFLVDVIKTIISIIATTFFVNGLRNRFTREVIEGGNEQ